MAIHLLFSGDFAPLVDPSKISKNHFSNLENILTTADCHITNFECPLTSVEKPISKIGPALKAQPEAIKVLKYARVDIACLANNHIFDYGEIGLQETIGTLEKNGIATLGIGNRPDAKKSWLIKIIKGKKIGFLNYCEHEFSVREKGEFGANGYDPIDCFHDVSVLRTLVDHLIVVYHGGNEYYPLPRPGLKKAFQYLADLGADAVIGHHTHVISGYELYNGKPLIYSLGNFYFPFADEPEEWCKGLLCEIILDSKISFELHVIEQNSSDFSLHLLKGEPKERIMIDIMEKSEIIRDEMRVLEEWESLTKKADAGYVKNVLNLNKAERFLVKFSLFEKAFINDKKLTRILNLMRNESHAELIQKIMKKRINR